MVDSLVSHFSVTVEDTPVIVIVDLLDTNIQFRSVTKRSTKPLVSGTSRTYDLNFGYVGPGSVEMVNIDIVPFEYNTADFDMNNEILFEDLVDLDGTFPLFFDVMPTVTSGTLHKSDLVVSTGGALGQTNCDVLVKRVLIDDVATGISNPFITQQIISAGNFFGMASNPVFRAGQIIGYDFILMYLPA